MGSRGARPRGKCMLLPVGRGAQFFFFFSAAVEKAPRFLYLCG